MVQSMFDSFPNSLSASELFLSLPILNGNFNKNYRLLQMKGCMVDQKCKITLSEGILAFQGKFRPPARFIASTYKCSLQGSLEG